MKDTQCVVYIVDDDFRVARGLSNALRARGMEVRTFSSAGEYIAFERNDTCACLILDLELPDANGLELQRKLADSDGPPIVFITGHGDIPSGVKAIKNGAIEFLTKPVDYQQLLAALTQGFAQDARNRAARSEAGALQTRLASLTPRELAVFDLVVTGRLNKQAAVELGITETTVQVHRCRVMKKMAAGSLAELVRMSTKLETFRAKLTPAAGSRHV
jgi:FixJ family two-component response regulator